MIFWDFDGVIKDSVEVKTTGYVDLFRPFGADVAERVRRHHEANGGMSRFEKIPLYLHWAGLTPSDALVAEYCERFSTLVRRAVVESPWVPGAREYLEAFCRQQSFVLISATPASEIEGILAELGISGCFAAVFGAPMAKSDAVARVLSGSEHTAEAALVIGDSESDMIAARDNGVSFLLRCTQLNGHIDCADSFSDFDQIFSGNQ